MHERFELTDLAWAEEDDEVDGRGSLTKCPPRNISSNSKLVLAIEVTKSAILFAFFELPT